MNEAGKFRYMITKKDFTDIENICNHSFAFQTVFFKCGPSYCYCRCAFDHEYFSYISDSGDVDKEKFDKLVRAVKDGYCPHTSKVRNKCYLRETSVNGIHIATALGFKSLTETFVSRLYERKVRVSDIKTSVFKLKPFDLSVLKDIAKISNLLRNA